MNSPKLRTFLLAAATMIMTTSTNAAPCGALLSHTAKVSFEVLEADKRPVSAVADNFEVREVLEVHVMENRSVSLTMLFDAGRSLEERVLAEQFAG